MSGQSADLIELAAFMFNMKLCSLNLMNWQTVLKRTIRKIVFCVQTNGHFKQNADLKMWDNIFTCKFRLRQLDAGAALGREIDSMADERRMLSRFGIWLMVAHCPPESAPPVSLPCFTVPLFRHLFGWALECPWTFALDALSVGKRLNYIFIVYFRSFHQ